MITHLSPLVLLRQGQPISFRAECLLCTLNVQLKYFLLIQAIFEHKTHWMRHNEDTKKCALKILPLRGFILAEG